MKLNQNHINAIKGFIRDGNPTGICWVWGAPAAGKSVTVKAALDHYGIEQWWQHAEESLRPRRKGERTRFVVMRDPRMLGKETNLRLAKREVARLLLLAETCKVIVETSLEPSKCPAGSFTAVKIERQNATAEGGQSE